MSEGDDRARRIVGQRVQRERGERTQREIEQASGIAQSTLSKVESGAYRALTIDLVMALAMALGVKPSKLLDVERLDDLHTIRAYESDAARGAA